MSLKKKARVAMDALLTAMIVFEMFIQYTGNLLHEVVGFAFFASVVGHLALSATWMKKTAAAVKKGTMTKRRTALAVMGVLLAITMAVLGVSSIAISGLLADAGFEWTFGPYAAWATVHAVSSYALCALVVAHLAMHWVFLASALRIEYDPSRRRAIGIGVNAVAAMGALALGITAVREALPQSIAEAISTDTSESNATPGNDDSTLFKDAPTNDLRHPNDSEDASDWEGENRHQNRKHKRHMADGSGETPTSKSTESPTEDKDSSSTSSEKNTETDSAWQDADTTDSWQDDGSVDYGYSSDYADAGEGDDTTYALGICTLCRKQCPLSAPLCNKPYEAGLL